MIQFIFRITLLVSIIGALLAVEFNSFHKAIAVKPVQVVALPHPAMRSASSIEIVTAKKNPRASL